MNIWLISLLVYILIGAAMAGLMVWLLISEVDKYTNGLKLEYIDESTIKEVEDMAAGIGFKAVIALLLIVITLFWLPAICTMSIKKS